MFPKEAECIEIQRFRFYGEKCLIIDSTVQTPKIKLGDSFHIVTKYSV